MEDIKRGVFFFLDITSSGGEKYEEWAGQIYADCKRILGEKGEPTLAFFKRRPKPKYGCIIKYHSKHYAKKLEEPFSLEGDDKITLYSAKSKTFDQNMYEGWKECKTKEGNVKFCYGTLQDESVIEELVRTSRREKKNTFNEKISLQDQIEEVVGNDLKDDDVDVKKKKIHIDENSDGGETATNVKRNFIIRRTNI